MFNYIAFLLNFNEDDLFLLSILFQVLSVYLNSGKQIHAHACRTKGKERVQLKGTYLLPLMEKRFLCKRKLKRYCRLC